ncbi:MAG: serine/threonine-protein kinase [Pseudomonadota bacterium]
MARDNAALPDDIDGYQIVDELGEGGMSVVYLAEQYEPVRRQVALKVIRPGMDTREVIARFESERQALAVMDHPNIARIFDAGTSRSGRPFFVMERVDGVPLNTYCDERRLSVRERLTVFLGVCDAVAHAHQKGVVHRDLKPSNVLVGEHDDQPQIKVIDFGIAKAIDARLSDDPLMTQLGQMIGTPGYMSPEQAAARVDLIDTRTDVYSLGVLLYQLLVGSLPFDVSRHSPQQLSTLINEGVTPRPSARLLNRDVDGDATARDRRTSLGLLKGQLARSLDWIILKAMEKPRERRYQSVYELKSDIQNYLAHQPVVARPPTPRYVFGQFVRRNRRAVTAASIVVLALVAGVTTATVGLIRAVESERDARRQSLTANTVVELFLNMFQEHDPGVAKGRDLRLLDVLDDNVSRMLSTLDNEPDVQSRLLFNVGVLYNNLDEHGKALPVLEQAFLQVQQMQNVDSAARADLLHALGEAQRKTDDFERARQSHMGALKLREALFGADSLAVADSQLQLGILARDSGNYTQADAAIDRALAAARAQGPANEARLLVASALNARAVSASLAGDLARAETAHREALVIKRELYGALHPSVATTLNNLAAVSRKLGKYDEAERLYYESLAMREKLYDADNMRIGTTINNLALLLHRRGQFDDAEAMYRRSLAIRRAEADPSTAVATALNNLAGLLSERGDVDGADAAFAESVAMRRDLQGPTHPNTAITELNLANHMAHTGRFSEACGAVPGIEATLQGSLPRDHWRRITVTNLKGVCAAVAGDTTAAEVTLTESLSALRDRRGDTSREAARAVERLIWLYDRVDKPERRTHYESILADMRGNTEVTKP